MAILYVFTGCEKNFETIETKDDTFILEVKNWFDEEIGNSLILDKHQNQLKSGSDNYCIQLDWEKGCIDKIESVHSIELLFMACSMKSNQALKAATLMNTVLITQSLNHILNLLFKKTK